MVKGKRTTAARVGSLRSALAPPATALGPLSAILAPLAIVLALLALPGSAAAGTAYAPANRPGPRLDVARARLAAALRCSVSLAHSRREPVLLVPGTELTPPPNFSWNYEPALAAAGFPYCTVTLPEHANGDIQTAAEYVVYAIRTPASSPR